MPATLLPCEHLALNADGRAVLARTQFKVMNLIREHVAYGWGAEELALNHPQLTLGEVYSALAWYADHAAELDATLAAEVVRAGAAHARPENRRLASLLRRNAAS